ncbi:MAG: hypothetical protein KGY67_00585 [Candidatus Thermoplasmatota archaeon]|nr:hypothetical protein [Candidatus Thermoplasmatota archaeon]
MEKKNWKIITIMLIVFAVFLLIYPVVSQPDASNTVKINHDMSGTKNIRIRKAETPTIFTDLSNNQIDQFQDVLGNEVKSVAVGPSWVCQGVVNDRRPMYGFSILIGEHGTSSEPLIFGLMNARLEGNDLYDTSNWDVVAVLNPDTLPEKDTFYWVSVEFDGSIHYAEDELFQIVAVCEDYGYEDNTWFFWGVSGDKGSVYSRGRAWKYVNDKWEVWSDAGDTTFITYTTETDEPPDDEPDPDNPPDLDVSFSTTVLSQTIGVFSLVGALVSGSKFYGWI